MSMMIIQMKTRRPRKKKPRLVRGFSRYLIIVCILFVMAFFYVKQRNSVTEMGYKINRLRRENMQLDQEFRSLQITLAELKRPDRIREMVRYFDLKLTEVESRQKVVIIKPEPVLLPANRDRLAGDGGNAPSKEHVARN